MTQFIVVTGEPGSVNPPRGIGIRQAKGQCFATRQVTRLLPSCGPDFFKIVDVESGEADSLIDGLHNDLRRNERGAGYAVLRFLQTMVEEGRGVLCWYGDEASTLPVLCTWGEFSDTLLRAAYEQPPEVYAMILPADGGL